VIPLNLRLKALYKNKDANYGKILDFKNEAPVRVSERYFEKGKYKKLNIVKEIHIIQTVDMKVTNTVINLC